MEKGTDVTVTVKELASIQKYREEWYCLKYNHNATDLRNNALQGKLRASRFRSLCWYLLLEILPDNPSEWFNHLMSLRVQYECLKQNLSYDPGNTETCNDNPLSQNDNSLWNKHFCDEELRSVINQDVVRTFPGIDFFKKPFIQQIMVTILFVYAREHPIMCYRQGMHELLAPILFVLHCDHQAMLHAEEQTDLDVLVKEILNPKYLEADGYNLFSKMMCSMASCYHINNITPTASGYFPTNSTSSDNPSTSTDSENEVILQLNSIRDELLRSVDLELYEHLKKLDITLPLFGIRWLRLLFGREFPLQDLLVLWDAIFSQVNNFKFVHYIVVSMLVAIRKQLLSGDYTTCLMHLMRYPSNVDVVYVIDYALHLQNPQAYPNPVKKELKRPRIHKKEINKHIDRTNVMPVVVKQVPIKLTTKSNNADVSYSLIENKPDRLLAELKHAHSIMTLSRLKLLQYHKILSKCTQNNGHTRDAMLALDGIYELCNLLTSRYYTQQSPTEVEHAMEAGEVRPTELNLATATTSAANITNVMNKQHIPKTKAQEMTLFACTEMSSLSDVPMTDPTRRT